MTKQAESLAMLGDTIKQIQHAQCPLQRKITKRQVPSLGDSGILSVRDANRSIVAREAREKLAAEKKLAKDYRKVYGHSFPLGPMQQSATSLAQRRAEEHGDIFLGR